MLQIDGKAIKRLRLRKGLNQEQFERQYGIPKRTQQRVENNIGHRVHEKTIIKYATIFKVPVESIIKDLDDL